MSEAFLISAPASGHGKTVITAALLRLLKRRGVAVAAAKAGPDYIDTAFHAAACGRPCPNIDPWAMSVAEQRARLAQAAKGAEMLIVEGVMGLFDGVAAPAGEMQPAGDACLPLPQARADDTLPPLPLDGSSAALAAAHGLPVLLVLDCARQGISAAAVARGFAQMHPQVRVAGVILNRLGSARHGDMIAAAIEEHAGLPVVGRFRRDDRLRLPERHLGLVQAGEHEELEAWLEGAADVAEEAMMLCRLANLTRPLPAAAQDVVPLPPLGQRIAIARDAAFAFVYEHWLADWRAQGAELGFFSPLADEAPPEEADAVFLPGGYPELHAARLAAAERFRQGLQAAAARGALIYGECGGYMALGRALIDAEGTAHRMAGLLPHATSFADRALHLGYRQLAHDSPLPFPRILRGHEFHYATVAAHDDAPALFEAHDAAGRRLGPMGMRVGNVMGSFAHVISADH